MMTRMKVALVLALVLCFQYSKAQLTGISDLETQQLRGPVKEVKEYRITEQLYLHEDTLREYQRRGIKPPYLKRELKSDTYFNRDGYITSRMEYGLLANSYTATYAGPGKPLENTYLNEDGTVRNRYTFKYDDEGKIVSAVRKSEDNVIFMEKFSFDPVENVLTCIHLNTDGGGYTVYVKKRPNGKLEYMKFKRDGEIYQQFLFDEKGRATEYYHTTSSGAFNNVMIYQGQQRLCEEYELMSDGSKKLTSTGIDKLDKYDNMLSSERFNSEGTRISYKTIQYKYDSRGNWIYRDLESSEQFDSGIIERVITYY